MDPDVLRLADAMDELASFLVVHNEPFWAEWVSKDAQFVRRGDGYGVTHFLSAFGGMGSLNDLYFHSVNWNARDDDAVTLNERFDVLKNAAWSQADALRHDAQ